MSSRLAQLNALGAMLMLAVSASGDIATTTMDVVSPTSFAVRDFRTPDSRADFGVTRALSHPPDPGIFAGPSGAAIWSLQTFTLREPGGHASPVFRTHTAANVAIFLTVLCGFSGCLVLRPTAMDTDVPRPVILEYAKVAPPLGDSLAAALLSHEWASATASPHSNPRFLSPFSARGPPSL